MRSISLIELVHKLYLTLLVAVAADVSTVAQQHVIRGSML